MITRNGDKITLEITMKEFTTLMIAMGYAMGAVMSISHIDLLDDFKQLLRSINEFGAG